MSNRLVVNPGTPQVWEIPLKTGTTRIGRSPQNDFPIDHPSLSPAHCEIVVSDAGVLLRDLGSASGTFVNRTPAKEVWLRPGQQVQIGAIATVFEAELAEPPTPNPAPEPVNQAAPGARVVVAGFSAPPITPERAPGTPNPAAALPRDQFDPQPVPVESAKPAAGAAASPRLREIGGAVGGALLGLVAWYAVSKTTGSTWGILAWGIGAAAGFGGRLLASQASLRLGVICAGAAALAIAGGELRAAKVIHASDIAKRATENYRRQLDYARAAARVETVEDARFFLAKRDGKVPSELTEEEVLQFQDAELPRLRDFAAGTPSEAEFIQRTTESERQSLSYRHFFFKTRTGLFLSLWAVLGVVTAFRVGSDQSRNT